MENKAMVVDMFSMYFDGHSTSEIADKYSLTRQRVEQLIDIRYWRSNKGINSIVYPNIRAWIKTHDYNLHRFSIAMGYTAKRQSAAGLTRILRGKCEMKRSDILKIHNITGLTVEQIIEKDGESDA